MEKIVNRHARVVLLAIAVPNTDIVVLLMSIVEAAANLDSAVVPAPLQVPKAYPRVEQSSHQLREHQVRPSLHLSPVQPPLLLLQPSQSQKMPDVVHNLEDRPAREAHMVIAAASTSTLVSLRFLHILPNENSAEVPILIVVLLRAKKTMATATPSHYHHLVLLPVPSRRPWC